VVGGRIRQLGGADGEPARAHLGVLERRTYGRLLDRPFVKRAGCARGDHDPGEQTEHQCLATSMAQCPPRQPVSH
jgi:hypothetical protein